MPQITVITPIVERASGFVFSWTAAGGPTSRMWYGSSRAAQQARLRLLIRIVQAGRDAVLHEHDGSSAMFWRGSRGLVFVETFDRRRLH